ncbi:hypothetical protein GQX74_004898 [Glossina fuscipes]|nr:hypothetical protein GQX74_004898 [Glossina fuscipes]
MQYCEFSSCSVTCSVGIRMRTRHYQQPEKAEAIMCTRQLVMNEMCAAAIPKCASRLLINMHWSAWSECSASCGIGITMRTRSFINHLGRKSCPHISMVEKQKHMQPDCVFEQRELPNPMRPATQWSDCSPCTATCGRGVTIRTRLLLLEYETIKKNCKKRLGLH